MRIPRCLTTSLENQNGIGLVGVMFAVSLLAIFALVAASTAVNERRTAFNDSIHERSFLAADSGSEAAIAWLYVQDQQIPYDAATKKVTSAAMDDMLMANDQGFAFDIAMEEDTSQANGLRKVLVREGFSEDLKYVYFHYEIDAQGEAGLEGRSEVRLNVSKLTKTGY